MKQCEIKNAMKTPFAYSMFYNIIHIIVIYLGNYF